MQLCNYHKNNYYYYYYNNSNNLNGNINNEKKNHLQTELFNTLKNEKEENMVIIY